jgi:hypothetical protein
MMPSDEYALYQQDREAWIAHVAPRMAERIAAMPDAEVADTWPRLSREYQLAVWELLDTDQRRRVRAARRAA